jgi:hypothetical protein
LHGGLFVSESTTDPMRDRRENPYAAPKAPIERSHPEPLPIVRRRAKSLASPPQYLLDCSCGRRVPVRASEAGSSVPCDCGRELRVPPLSKLRELSGADPYESSTIDTIRRMIREGALPPEENCAVTGEPTREVLMLTIKLPTAFKTKGGILGERLHLLLVALVSWWLLFLPSLSGRTVGVEEGATVIQVPLRVCNDAQRKLRGARPARLKRLLRTVPIYAELLNENPFAMVSLAPVGPSIEN